MTYKKSIHSLAGLFAIIASSSLQAQVQLPHGQELQSIDFQWHVAPLLSKLGCNSGSCHGNSEGKGGFRLSLFGYDPQMDHRAITDSEAGRIDLEKPETSLLLQKPSLAVEHGGGERFASDSWEYALLRRWITDGARMEKAEMTLVQLHISPPICTLRNERITEPLKVIASYANGEQWDVTPFSSLSVHDDSICVVASDATLRRVGAGDTYVIATYAGRPANARIMAPRMVDGASIAIVDSPLSVSDNFIDKHIQEKLDVLNIIASPQCGDEVFLRRLVLVTTGRLPTPEQLQQFAADTSPQKRSAAVSQMLADPLHASVWATRMCEIMGSRDIGNSMGNPKGLQEEKWYAWFQKQFEANAPYDSLTCRILCATSRGNMSAADYVEEAVEAATANASEDAVYSQRDSLDLFWQRPKVNEEIELERLSERIAAAFLGIRLECAKCHKHPFDRWSQDDYRSFANNFSQVRFGLSPELRIALADKIQQQRERVSSGDAPVRVPTMREVYLTDATSDLRRAADRQILPARPLGGNELLVQGDRRTALVAWLTNDTNPFFARNFVNRVWGFYFGRGIVDPVDKFSASNPPTHPELLDALAASFIESGYNIRRLEELILSSDTWQRSAEPNATNRDDSHNYARFYIRVLPAATVVDSIASALGTQPLAAARIATQKADDSRLQTYFDVFSRPERKSTCDCERSSTPTLRQAMLLLSDAELHAKIAEASVGIAVDFPSNDQQAVDHLIDQLFIRTLCHRPDDDQRQATREQIERQTDVRRAVENIWWSLINTREFVTLH